MHVFIIFSYVHLSNKRIVVLSPLLFFFIPLITSVYTPTPTLPDPASILSSSTVMLYVIGSLPSEEQR